MKVTIDEQGSVSPKRSALLILDRADAEDVPSGGLLPPYRASVRIFECTGCKRRFEARAGQVTTHECDEE